jgi:predicted dehydrogenase
MGEVRVGVIGAGNIAAKHLETLAAFSDVDIVALASRGNPRVKALADRFGVERIFSGYRAMLDGTDLDAVFVLVSATSIVEVASECLRRGLPTLMEKPAGLSVAETKGLREIAETTNCLNMVGLNRRFYGVMRAAREAILEKGPLVSVVVEAPENLAVVRAVGIHPPEVVRGLLYANSIHCIDLLRYFGGEVAEVHALSGQWNEEQSNSFGALMKFEGGAIGQYVSNWTSPGSWSVTLYGMGRRITLDPLERGTITDDGKESVPIVVDEVDTLFKPGLHGQNRFFLDCVKEKRKVTYPAADLADAVKTMELIAIIDGGAQ